MGNSSGGSWASAELTQHAQRGFLRKVGVEGGLQRAEASGQGGREKWSVGPRVGGSRAQMGEQGLGSLARRARWGGRECIPYLLCDGLLTWGIHTGYLIKPSVVRELK